MSEKSLCLTEADVRRLLPMGECISLVRASFRAPGPWRSD